MKQAIGLVGLGKMGFNLALNLHRNQYQVVAYDVATAAVDQLAQQGITPATSLAHLVAQLSAPRAVWLMVPAGDIVDSVIDQLRPHLQPGDTLIDGGNSFYQDSLRRHQALQPAQIHFVDCGTSGGLSGALHGACTMVGGQPEAVKPLEDLFRAISVPDGYLYAGPPGSGHFVKMVHNGIEYGMMQAIAEGFEVLEKSEFPLDFEQVARVWNHGSVIRGWLMELTQNAFRKDAHLDKLRGVMHSSGEGKWTLETALDLGVATPVIALSLLMRYRSQQTDTFAGKVVAALRNEFGGHQVETH
ncbi:MAG: decarboxylating 6-phosphogluconate dehydrogenase [Bernardetiaceae bacterium]|jgi:6-phosphogluconate dehydrogenase|nr:decarboxylating 6-phosphogluconate dehydrogenase [Bernardetiaceae bacterium]